MGNIDKIGHFVAEVTDKIFRPSATVIFSLQAGPNLPITIGRRLDVGIASADNPSYMLLKTVTRDSPATFVVPANKSYTVYWQGSGFLAASYSQLLAPASTIHALLVGKARQDDVLVLQLRLDDPSRGGEKVVETTNAPAELLLTQVNPQGALPGFDRAVAIVGMFVTGTTTCGKTVFNFGDFEPNLGCLGMSLADVLPAASVEMGGDATLGLNELTPHQQELLQKLMTLRFLDKDITSDRDYGPLVARVTQVPEVWVAAQTRALQLYAEALGVARALRLRSERGVLLAFDRIVMEGSARVTRAVPEINRAIADGGGEPTEAGRIAVAAAYFRDNLKVPGPLRAALERQINTIESGKGSLRGVDFDLDQIGITLEPMYGD